MQKLTCRHPQSFIFYVILDSGNTNYHNRKTNQGHLNTNLKLLILLCFLIINWLCNHCFTQHLRFLFWFLSTFSLKGLNNIIYGTYLIIAFTFLLVVCPFWVGLGWLVLRTECRASCDKHSTTEIPSQPQVQNLLKLHSLIFRPQLLMFESFQPQKYALFGSLKLNVFYMQTFMLKFLIYAFLFLH